MQKSHCKNDKIIYKIILKYFYTQQNQHLKKNKKNKKLLL